MGGGGGGGVGGIYETLPQGTWDILRQYCTLYSICVMLALSSLARRKHVQYFVKYTVRKVWFSRAWVFSVLLSLNVGERGKGGRGKITFNVKLNVTILMMPPLTSITSSDVC